MIKKMIDDYNNRKFIKRLNLAGIDYVLYASGQIPAVGDIVDVGSENRRYLITHIDEYSSTTKIMSGNFELKPENCVLKARHGKTI